MTAQGLSFAQAHLVRSWQENAAGVERTGGCPLNQSPAVERALARAAGVSS